MVSTIMIRRLDTNSFDVFSSGSATGAVVIGRLRVSLASMDNQQLAMIWYHTARTVS